MPGLQSQDDLDLAAEPPDHVCFIQDEELVVDDGVDEEEFVEHDPTGRYGRYREVLGKGAMKTVFRAYDRVDCKEVAWNQAKPFDCGGGASVEREVQILKSLNHKGVIKLYSDWVDMETGNTNFITELCSATLLGYRMKHKHASRKAVKSWGRQILSEIAHLHAHNPPIIHRDLKCENIFIKCSANCTLKLGDFGSATLLDETKHLHTLVGTPEFMAPEMYEEDYNELVDVYSFGMCMLELLTRECPYSECKNVAEIYKKVTSGIKPESLGKVKDVQALRLINRCLLPASLRPSAIDLLSDPFLQYDEIAHMDSSRITCVESTSKSLTDITNQADLLQMVLVSEITSQARSTPSSDADVKENTANCLDPMLPITDIAVNSCKSNVINRLQRQFQVTGYVEDETTIRLQLRIQQSGRVRDIMFPFDVIHDSPASVAEELVRTLEYPESDMAIIADLMATKIFSIASKNTESKAKTTHSVTRNDGSFENDDDDKKTKATVRNKVEDGQFGTTDFGGDDNYFVNASNNNQLLQYHAGNPYKPASFPQTMDFNYPWPPHAAFFISSPIYCREISV